MADSQGQACPFSINEGALGGLAVTLTGEHSESSIVSPATPVDRKPYAVFGDLEMYAHKRSGRVALARNEVADWYYERLQ